MQKEQRNSRKGAIPEIVNRIDAFTVDDSKTHHKEWLAKSSQLRKMMQDVGAPPAVKSSSTSRVVSSTGASAPVARTVARTTFKAGPDDDLSHPGPTGMLSVVPITDDLVLGAKSHELRSAQALWALDKKKHGPALSYTQFKRTFKLKTAFAELNAPNAASSDEDETVWGDSEATPALADGDFNPRRLPTLNSKLTARIALIKGGNVPKTMPVEVFLDEYSEELLHYLMTPARRQIGDKPLRRWRLIRRGLRRSLGIPLSLRRLLQGCTLFGVVLAGIAVGLGVWILQLSSHLDKLREVHTLPATPLEQTHELSLNQHTIQLTASGTSFVCRCFDIGISEEHQLLSIKPELAGDSIQVVKSLSLYSTATESAECATGANFDCAEYFGGMQSTLLLRWDSYQNQRRIREDEPDFNPGNPLQTKADDRMISLPADVSLKLTPQNTRTIRRGRPMKHRLLLVGWYELMENPAFMNPALWQARQPWAKLGLHAKISRRPPRQNSMNASMHDDGRAFRAENVQSDAGPGTMLSLASVDFVVPRANPRFIYNFTVGVAQQAGWLSQYGQQHGFTIFGAVLTTRRVGISGNVRLLRPISTNTSDLQVVGEFGVRTSSGRAADQGVKPGHGQQGMLIAGQTQLGRPRMDMPGGARLAVRPGDVIEVVCSYNTADRTTDVRAAWVSKANEPTEICAAELMVHPAAAIQQSKLTVLPQQCTVVD
eukprot:SAG31_NODE_340_length_17466_cov_5.689987_5_plen_714_part_00